MKLKPIGLLEAEFVAHETARAFMNFDEPLPPFETRYPGKLESCLAQPFQTYDGKPLYRTLVDRGALLFYLVIKNHPFSNGNKRMAVTLTLVLFYRNKHWINVNPKVLYKIACDVAESTPQEKKTMLQALTIFFKNHKVKSSQMRAASKSKD